MRLSVRYDGKGGLPIVTNSATGEVLRRVLEVKWEATLNTFAPVVTIKFVPFEFNVHSKGDVSEIY